MMLCAVFTVILWMRASSAVALIEPYTSVAETPEQASLLQLIQDLQSKYDAKLASYDAKIERYENQIQQHETTLKSHDSKFESYESTIKALEARITSYEEAAKPATNRDVTTAVTDEKGKHKYASDVTRHNNGEPKRNRRLVLSSAEMPVAFYAQLTHDQTGVGNYQTIVFDLVTTNVGNAYNGNDGVFTAPVAGVYTFIWTASNHDNSHMQTELVVNAVVNGRQWSDSGNHADISSATGSAVLRLNATDTVWIRSNTIHSHQIMGSQLSSFSGFLLFE